jgi:ribonuclease P protein component
VKAVPSHRDHVRVGIVVPRFGRTAVRRNRLKRQIRELVRLELIPELAFLDVVLRVGPATYERTFDQLRIEVREVLGWLRQLQQASPATS